MVIILDVGLLQLLLARSSLPFGLKNIKLRRVFSFYLPIDSKCLSSSTLEVLLSMFKLPFEKGLESFKAELPMSLCASAYIVFNDCVSSLFAFCSASCCLTFGKYNGSELHFIESN
jgi:hypothetical protein